MTDSTPGPLAEWLQQQGFDTQPLANDHLGIERIGVEPQALPLVATALKSKGFDYLQVQGAYDEGPGENLVSFYHLVQVGSSDGNGTTEVRLEVSLPAAVISAFHPFIPSIAVPIGRSGNASTCLVSPTAVTPCPSVF